MEEISFPDLVAVTGAYSGMRLRRKPYLTSSFGNLRMQIPGLIEQRNRIQVIPPIVGEFLACRGESPVGEGGHIEADLTETLYEEGRRPRLEPVITEFHICKAIQKTERVINPFTRLMEPITVIFFLKPRKALILRKLLLRRQPFDLRFEIVRKLLPRNPADPGIIRDHRDVIQLIQITENAHLAELRHPGDKHEPDVIIIAL